MKKNKFTFEDEAWEEMEEFYGDDLEINDPDFISDVDINKELGFDSDDVEFVDESLLFDVIGPDGNAYKYEFVGRIDIEGKTYLMLHWLDDNDSSSIHIWRARDDENGRLVVEAITDDKEYSEVSEYAEKILNDFPGSEDVAEK